MWPEPKQTRRFGGANQFRLLKLIITGLIIKSPSKMVMLPLRALKKLFDKRPCLSSLLRPISLVFIMCMVMFGNGSKIFGITTIITHQQMELPGQKRGTVQNPFYEEAPGLRGRKISALLSACMVSQPTGLAIAGFALREHLLSKKS